MCLAIPVRVVEVRPDQKAVVDLAGVRKEISTALVDSVAVDEYVIVHVGYAIGKVDADEAQRTLELFNQIEQAASAEGTMAQEVEK
ncbi:MAG TPA: HypC/HybG/HupF family hydrogenase formation chaperone [Noviherbaspirillum sp.]